MSPWASCLVTTPTDMPSARLPVIGSGLNCMPCAEMAGQSAAVRAAAVTAAIIDFLINLLPCHNESVRRSEPVSDACGDKAGVHSPDLEASV